MLPQKKLSIAAHAKLILKSGSYHLMLAKPEKRLLSGHKIQLNFTLSNGDKTSLMINIRKKPRPMKCGAGKCGSM